MLPLSDKEVKELTHSDRVTPEFIVGKCLQCGNCCKYVKCSQYDKGCKIYKNRPVCCRVHPNNRADIINSKCKGFKCLRG